MNYLVNAIVEKLELQLSTAVAASQQARDSATHSENTAAITNWACRWRVEY
ncbi:MAG: hypothetical protein ACI9IN_001188 [Porticoccaceae bacterium]|jgi:hypothetical protein